MSNIFGAEFRRVENREYQGKTAVVAVAIRSYDTSVDDLWDAITTPERLRRWFLPVTGDLRLGGRYQLEGNAGGTITTCQPPETLDLTWEYAGGTSWVTLNLTPDGDKARLTLEHIAHTDGVGASHFEQFGPAAVGTGWDLTLNGLALHLTDPAATIDPAAYEAWTMSPDGKAFIRGSGQAWGEAHASSGHDAEQARAMAERTIAFYSGE